MPDEIRRLAEDMLADPVTVQVDKVKPASTVRHALYPITQHLKTPLLMKLLDKYSEGSILVFTRTKHRAKRIGELLQKAGQSATSIQGNLSQNRRQEAMDGFRDGTYRILVATDIAARGIDVSLVSLVVNYDVPETPDMYIHRIGRTGRAQRSGEAVTFVTGEDTAMVKAVERLLGKPIERRTVHDFDYSVPAPKKDEEFKRPPREQQQRRNSGTVRKGTAHGTAATQPGATKENTPGRPQQQTAKPKFAGRPPRSRQGR